MAYSADDSTESLQASIVVSTCDRAHSLSETLACIAASRRPEHRIEVVVVDNGNDAATKSVCAEYTEVLNLRYLAEPRSGKAHAMNRALSDGNLGDIVVFLDDDMSPNTDWVGSVISMCARFPEHDIFTGPIRIIWPPGDRPGWAHGALHGWAYSARDFGDVDRELLDGDFPSGNHFWIRSRVLRGDDRFEDIWPPESSFVLNLAARGCRIMSGREAIVGHRVQEALFRKDVIWKRAVATGRGFADARLRPPRSNVRISRKFKDHPFLCRLYCIVRLARWTGASLLGGLRWSADKRFYLRAVARERIAYYREALRIAQELDAYRVFKRRGAAS